MVKTRTVYQSDTGDGDPSVTRYSYLWHAGSLQPSQITTHLPDVPADQNGGVALINTTTVARYDELGRMTEQTDARGFKTRYGYDTATGAQIQMVRDPGGLNIVPDDTVDDRGRRVQSLGPAREVDGRQVRTASWSVYKDEYETWTARGYLDLASQEKILVNPVNISRTSPDGKTRDSITATVGANVESTIMLADLAAAGGEPFPRSTWTVWTQNRYDVNGRMVASRVYHNIPTSGTGSPGVNYLETTYAHDVLARQHRTVDPTGMITRTVFDSLSRTQSTWIGTNDDGATASDPTGSAANDMVMLTNVQYDGGQVGDGNLTQSVQHVDDNPNNDRTMRYTFDWRNRSVDSIAVGPNDREIVTRQTYDNLGRTVVSETLSRRFNQETLATRTRTLYNDRSQSYRQIRDGVDQQTGQLTGEVINQDTQFDAAGNSVKQTPAGAADFMTYRYDAVNRQVATGNAVALEQLTIYNGASEAIGQTDELLHTTTSVYDEIGRMLKTVNHLGESSSVSEYDIAGRMSAQIDPFGQRTQYVYDDAGRTVSVTDPEGNTVSTLYDDRGRVESTTTPSGTTRFGYDFQNRQIQTIDPMLDVTQVVYNRVGDVLETIDAKQQSSLHQFDILGRATQTTDRLGGVTSYGFDRIGRRDSITDADGGITRYGFDAFGRASTTIHADHVDGSLPGDANYGIVRQEFDNHDRMFRRTDQLGDTVTYRFDTRGRLIARDYRHRASSPLGSIADSDTFVYDDANRMTTATSGRYANEVTLGYDDANRQISESLQISGQTYTVTTAYDIASRVDQVTYPNGSVVGRSYNTRHLLSAVTLDGEVIDSRKYDSSNRLQRCTYANGVTTNFSYRADDLVSQISTRGPAVLNPQSYVGTYGYQYDANKNKTAETIIGSGVMDGFGFSTGTDGYDAENRLTAWNRTDGNQDQTWGLSLVGDWNQSSENGAVTAYAHNAAHELTSAGFQPVGYDAKGNALNGLSGSVYTWDFDNRLVAVGSTQFEYDALGRRVFDGDSNEVLVCSGQRLLATYQVDTAPTSPSRQFVYGDYIDEPILLLIAPEESSGGDNPPPSDPIGPGPIAFSDFGGISPSPTGPAQLQRFYYSRNQQFSITALTDETGSVVERYHYDAYGTTQILDPSGTPRAVSSVDNPFMFTGRYHHPNLGLYYFRARYYDSAIGRFVGRDPLEFVDGMSLYRAYFVPGGVDPSGTHEITFDECTCNDAQIATIEAAWESGRVAANSAIDEMSILVGSPDREHYLRKVTVVNQFRIFFETPDADGRLPVENDKTLSIRDIKTTIKSVFQRTADGMLNKPVKVYCGGDSCSDDGPPAYHYDPAIGYSSIVFCPKFFNKDSASEQAGIAFHEASHKWAGTNDWGYMHSQPAVWATARGGPDSRPFANHYWTRFSIGFDTPGYLSSSYLMDNASTYQYYLVAFHLR